MLSPTLNEMESKPRVLSGISPLAADNKLGTTKHKSPSQMIETRKRADLFAGIRLETGKEERLDREAKCESDSSSQGDPACLQVFRQSRTVYAFGITKMALAIAKWRA